MPVSIESQPDGWSLSRNGVGWVLSSDNEYSSSGVTAILDLTWTLPNYPADGEQMTISWDSGNESVTLTFRVSPNDSGEEVELVTTSASDFLIALRSSIERNWKLSQAFTITSTQIGGDRITLVAKEAGAKYTCAFSESTSSAVSTAITNGVDSVRRSNFKLILELEMWNSAAVSDKTKVVLEGTPVNGEVDFDISDILDSDVWSNTLPTESSAVMENLSRTAVQFGARWGEKYGDPLAIRRLSTKSTYSAMVGGWSKDRSATATFQEWVDDGKFLTNLTERRISRTQNEYLYFIDASGLLTSHVEIFYTDGTSEVKNLLTAPTTSVDTLWCIPFRFTQILAVANGAKEISYWEVFLSKNNPGTPISNKVRYESRDEFEIDSTELLFRNVFGVYEVIDCPGEVEVSSSIEKRMAERILSRGYGVNERSSITVRASYSDERIVSTGWLSRDEADWLQELLISDHVYEKREGVFYPVSIDSDTIDKYSSRSDELNSLQFMILSDVQEVGR